MQTLMLTPWMAPHKIISWQRAVVLTYLGKVEVIETWDAELRIPSLDDFNLAEVGQHDSALPRDNLVRRHPGGQHQSLHGYLFFLISDFLSVEGVLTLFGY